MAERLTRRAETDEEKAVWYGEREVFLEGEIGYAEADKLAHYEDLEEQLEKLYGGKMPLDEVVENLNRIVQNGEEKLEYARILTNAEAEKWDKWLSLEEQGRLIELPCKLKNIIDVIFSHNEIVTLMCDGVDKNGTRCCLHFWHGMAWNIPKEYLELQFVKIHGVVSDKPDTLYVEVDAKFTEEEAIEAWNRRAGEQE